MEGSKVDGKYPYQTAVVPFLSEMLKLGISAVVLQWQLSRNPRGTKITQGWGTAILYPIPSVIYLVHNNVQVAFLLISYRLVLLLNWYVLLVFLLRLVVCSSTPLSSPSFPLFPNLKVLTIDEKQAAYLYLLTWSCLRIETFELTRQDGLPPGIHITHYKPISTLLYSPFLPDS